MKIVRFLVFLSWSIGAMALNIEEAKECESDDDIIVPAEGVRLPQGDPRVEQLLELTQETWTEPRSCQRRNGISGPSTQEN